jgi:hypothetical protein
MHLEEIVRLKTTLAAARSSNSSDEAAAAAAEAAKTAATKAGRGGASNAAVRRQASAVVAAAAVAAKERKGARTMTTTRETHGFDVHDLNSTTELVAAVAFQHAESMKQRNAVWQYLNSRSEHKLFKVSARRAVPPTMLMGQSKPSIMTTTSSDLAVLAPVEIDTSIMSSSQIHQHHQQQMQLQRQSSSSSSTAVVPSGLLSSAAHSQSLFLVDAIDELVMDGDTLILPRGGGHLHFVPICDVDDLFEKTRGGARTLRLLRYLDACHFHFRSHRDVADAVKRTLFARAEVLQLLHDTTHFTLLPPHRAPLVSNDHVDAMFDAAAVKTGLEDGGGGIIVAILDELEEEARRYA